MRHVVMFSGGVGSWAAAKRVAEQHGTDQLWLVFCDTLVEHPDLYRFLVDAAADVYRCAGRLDGLVTKAASTPPSTRPDDRRRWLADLRAHLAPLMPRFVWLCEGRTIWEVFREERFLGNSRAGVCTSRLKQDVADRYLRGHFDPADTTVYVGIDWTEEHRLTRLQARRAPWRYEAPLCDAPYETKDGLLAALERQGIRTPELYRLGFAHNNCGGGCVKAGIGHFAHLYRTLPSTFAEWEQNEQALRDVLGDVSMLTDRRGGEKRPLPLTQLRRRLEAGEQPDLFEIGGCGCFIDTEAAA